MILIVDDDSAVRSSLSFMLKRAGYEVKTAPGPREAMDIVRAESPALILMDMNFTLSTTGEEGLTLLKQVKVFRPDVPVILMTAWGSIQLAVQGMQAGAFDFITKPWNNAALLQRIETALELSAAPKEVPEEQAEGLNRSHIIGKSQGLMEVLNTVARIARTNASVLITGESGTGKELIAEAIHINSQRTRQPFVKVNLGGISPVSYTHLDVYKRQIIDRVKTEGDRAVLEYEEKFDKVALTALAVTEAEQAEAEALVGEELKKAIRLAKRNIETFHAAQRFESKRVETQPGVTCWQKAVAIEKVGLYIPGGTAPLFSTVLMLAVPARIAGCKEIVLCTPPGKDGKVHPAVLFAAKVAGINRIFKAGGVQAIAAMAYGTESVPKVYKIFGPGNQYVTAAKQLVSLRDVAIDMPAGPSEVEVLADETANPSFVAADLLSQAEHGADSQAILITTSPALQQAVKEEVERQLALLPRKEIAEKSLANSKLIVVRNMDEAIELTNSYAPEHLIIETADYMSVAERVVNAGSVFLGSLTPESAGDYASGTNHTLPTNGYAKAYSGVSLDSFIRKITFQEIKPEGIRIIGPAIEEMAASEHLDAHKNAVTVRLDKLRVEN